MVLVVAAYCHSAGNYNVAGKIVNSSDRHFKPVNGILYFNNHPFSGTVFTMYDDSADTAALSGYIYGREHGIWKSFYAGGKPKMTREFNNGLKTGEYIAWWENGNIQLHYF